MIAPYLLCLELYVDDALGTVGIEVPHSFDGPVSCRFFFYFNFFMVSCCVYLCLVVSDVHTTCIT